MIKFEHRNPESLDVVFAKYFSTKFYLVQLKPQPANLFGVPCTSCVDQFLFEALLIRNTIDTG